MKLKSILLTSVATIILATTTMAQVPNYLPTNGLVGWWPFNGNANDESGNGNNGTNNGATLTNDRNGIINKAYSFAGGSDYIAMPSGSISSLNITSDISVSMWYKCGPHMGPMMSFQDNVSANAAGYGFHCGVTSLDKISFYCHGWYALTANNQTDNNWHQVCATLFGSNLTLYLDGVVSNTYTGVTAPLSWSYLRTLGVANNPTGGLQLNGQYYSGVLDDIAVWNRALTQQEISDLYNAVNCANNTSISPQTNSITSGSAATFTASTTDPNPSYVWQSNFGQGFQTLNNFGNYSGVNTATLNITNVQLSEHNQPVRVITTSGNCIDTSNVAVINILDTCIVTIYDTLLTTVTDTLVINATITGLNPPNNLNTIKVFPNPANDHITINYGNFASMSGYMLKIVNAVGQTVFTTPINQQSSYIDLSTWTGNGIYFVQLIDPQNNTVENRKIIIQ
jgi:hypothetical protein